MTRELKMTIKQVGSDACDILCQIRDNNDPWQIQGVIPVFGTLEQVRAERIANQIRWGWIPYDAEEGDTVTFWKEF